MDLAESQTLLKQTHYSHVQSCGYKKNAHVVVKQNVFLEMFTCFMVRDHARVTELKRYSVEKKHDSEARSRST